MIIMDLDGTYKPIITGRPGLFLRPNNAQVTTYAMTNAGISVVQSTYEEAVSNWISDTISAWAGVLEAIFDGNKK